MTEDSNGYERSPLLHQKKAAAATAAAAYIGAAVIKGFTGAPAAPGVLVA
jgi:hypothetical protein